MHNLFTSGFALLLLCSFALGHPLEARNKTSADSFVLTALSATFPSDGAYGLTSADSSLTIHLDYPDPDKRGKRLSTICSAGWPKGTVLGPTNWIPCEDSAVQFRLPKRGWESPTRFTLEGWQELSTNGVGLDAVQELAMDPANPSDPTAFLFCVQRGKFNPLSCDLTGPYGFANREVVIPTNKLKTIPH
ncbi:hypothetical protein F5Y18DRAFT_435818 [Xylariaceae sp. FL1019]|nr:hypothetical protein F5Y18DRAFT_435818 [Xylariaceae sp. FL1019]